MINRITEYFGSLGENAVEEEERKTKTAQGLQDAVQTTMKKSGTFVADHPVICLSAALAAGVAVGWWVKRK